MNATHGGKRPGAGRPKGSRDRATAAQRATLTELAREHTEVALRTLVGICQNSENESARVTAANALLDRGYGKPAQAHELSMPTGNPIQITFIGADADL